MTSSNNIRVCMVAPLYHLTLGGLGRQAQFLTERLADAGVRVFVVTRKMKGVPDSYYRRDVRVVRVRTPWPGMPVLEEIGIKSLLISLVFSLGAGWVLLRNRNRYDVVHFHGARAALFVTLPLLCILGKKTVAKVSGSKQPFEVGSLAAGHGVLRRVLAALARRVDRYVAISSEIERGLLEDGIGRGKIVRLPNFVRAGGGPEDMRQSAQLRDMFGVGGRTVVLYSGRLAPCKGIECMLQAWTGVVGEYQNVLLIILGEGPLRGALESIVDNLGISRSVLFVGWHDNVEKFLAETDVFVHPSLHEGLSNSLLEAMAAGLPVVATRIGGTEDVIEHGVNGLLVEPDDSVALSSGILRCLEDKEFALSLGRKAVETIRNEHDLEIIHKKYIGLYQVLTERDEKAA